MPSSWMVSDVQGARHRKVTCGHIKIMELSKTRRQPRLPMDACLHLPTSNSISSGIWNSRRISAWNSRCPSSPGLTLTRWTARSIQAMHEGSCCHDGDSSMLAPPRLTPALCPDQVRQDMLGLLLHYSPTSPRVTTMMGSAGVTLGGVRTVFQSGYGAAQNRQHRSSLRCNSTRQTKKSVQYGHAHGSYLQVGVSRNISKKT